MKDILQETLEILMLEMIDGRCFEDSEMEHSCDIWYTEVAHFGKEMLLAVLYTEVALVKQNYKMH